MARKQCDGCGLSVGVRTKQCPDCGQKFIIKKRGPRPQAIDWTELKTGDVIKVVTGTGPYFLSKDKPGEKIMMGQKGKFEVVELYGIGKPDGCGVVGRQLFGNHRAGVIEYIYMGDTWYNDNLSIHEEPHKIMGIKTEATVIEKIKKRKSRKKRGKKSVQANPVRSKLDVNSINQMIKEIG